MKRVVIKILGAVIITVMILQTVTMATSSSTSQLESEKNENDEKIDSAQEELEDVQAQISSTQEEINNLSSQISDYESQISELDTKISELNEQIEEAQNKLEEMQAEYDKSKELAEERLVVMQESGETTYLDLILSSNSIVDLISSYYLAAELAEADMELLDSLETQKNEVEQAKTELENSKTELDNSKTTKEAISAQLEVLKSEKDAQVAELSEEEQEIQAQIDELTEANAEIDKQIQEMEAKIKAAEEAAKAAASSSSSSTSSGSSSGTASGSADFSKISSYGFIYPVPSGYQTITTGIYYSSGAYHGAVDFGSSGINGQPIFAVADGTVIISERLSGSYGNYIVIKHDNGLYTLYAHGQDGSRTVSAGDRVVQGQQIMKVGSTGNSTGPHLHFEVRTSPGTYDCRVNPKNYLP